jgi:hypothetical protein
MMIIYRRFWLAWLAVGLITLGLNIQVAARDGAKQVVEIKIEARKVVAPVGAIKLTQGNAVELHWNSDEQVELHIHGYNLELTVVAGEPGILEFDAHASGRFPITSHGWGKGGHSHDALTYLEVYPR